MANLDQIADYLADANTPIDNQDKTVISWASGITGGVVHLITAGKLVAVYVNFTHSAAWTSGTQYTVGTLPEELRPMATIIGKSTGTIEGDATITNAGVIGAVPRSNRNAGVNEYYYFPLYFVE